MERNKAKREYTQTISTLFNTMKTFGACKHQTYTIYRYLILLLEGASRFMEIGHLNGLGAR